MNLKNFKNEEFYEKLDAWCESLDKFADKFHQALTVKVDKISNYISNFGDHFLDLLQPINELLMVHYKKARYLTIPLHWIWIFLWAYLENYDDQMDPTNKEGLHYIQAPVGGGKSTFEWQKMYDYGRMTGKCSYVTTKMERVKYDEMGQPYLNHIRFDIQEFWGQKNEGDKFGSQLKRFNSKLSASIVIDELHVLNNNRNNRTSEYNHTFIPMVNSFVLQRHFGIKWILVASQMPKNDTQIMSILTSYNKIKIKKGFVYKKWLEDGKFSRRIKGWSVHTYSVSADNDYLKLDSKQKWFKEATVDFSDFETLNMKDMLNSVSVDRRAVLS